MMDKASTGDGGRMDGGPVEGATGMDRTGGRPVARAVLWDLDGTLVDSAEQHWQAWRETLEANGFTVTRDQFRATFGQRNDAILGEWLGQDADPAAMRELGDRKEERYRELVAESGIEPLAGARHWIATLEADGWRQAVASSAPRLNVEAVLRALDLDDVLATIVAAEDVRHGKPAPDVFLTAANRLSVEPAGCVVVEDAAAGVEAARRAGMACIGIGATGFAEADIIVRSLADLQAGTFDRLLDRKG